MSIKNWIWAVSSACFIFLVSTQSYSIAVGYKLAPGESMVVTNTFNKTISAFCFMFASTDTTNNISINMLRGSGLFNGTSLSQGQTLVQTIYNTQYVPISANQTASALITNISTYTLQAQCDLG